MPLIAAAGLIACNFIVSLPPQDVVHPVTDAYPFDQVAPPWPTIPCDPPALVPGQIVRWFPASKWVAAAPKPGDAYAPLFHPVDLKRHEYRLTWVGAPCNCLNARQVRRKRDGGDIIMVVVYCTVPRVPVYLLDQWPQLAECVPVP